MDAQRAGHLLPWIQQQRPASAALVVIDHREVLLQRPLELPQRRDQRRRRPAVHEQQQRVVAVLAAHVHPLRDAADLRRVILLHAAGRDDAPQVGDDPARRRVAGAVRAGLLRSRRQGRHGQHQRGQRAAAVFDHRGRPPRRLGGSAGKRRSCSTIAVTAAPGHSPSSGSSNRSAAAAAAKYTRWSSSSRRSRCTRPRLSTSTTASVLPPSAIA